MHITPIYDKALTVIVYFPVIIQHTTLKYQPLDVGSYFLHVQTNAAQCVHLEEIYLENLVFVNNARHHPLQQHPSIPNCTLPHTQL